MFRCVYTFDSESWMKYTFSIYGFFPLFTHLNIVTVIVTHFVKKAKLTD